MTDRVYEVIWAGWTRSIGWRAGLFMRVMDGLEGHKVMYVGLLVITIPWTEGKDIFYGYLFVSDTCPTWRPFSPRKRNTYLLNISVYKPDFHPFIVSFWLVGVGYRWVKDIYVKRISGGSRLVACQ